MVVAYFRNDMYYIRIKLVNQHCRTGKHLSTENFRCFASLTILTTHTLAEKVNSQWLAQNAGPCKARDITNMKTCCCWLAVQFRYIDLVRVMEDVNNLNLDALSLQSGYLNETLRAWQSSSSLFTADNLIYPVFIR